MNCPPLKNSRILNETYIFHRYATGVTLKKLQITSASDTFKELGKEIFGKKVRIESFAVYWKPMDHLFSEDKSVLQSDNEPVVDELFNKGICEKSSTKMKFLIGPISSEAQLQYCPRPERIQFEEPEVSFSQLETPIW